MSQLISPEAINAENGERIKKGTEMDHEIKVISAILRKLDELEDGAKSRVVAYVSDRFHSKGHA